MANNRVWLVHRPTGEAICLGKRMAYGWYNQTEMLGTKLAGFFARCEESQSRDQDDFVLAMEDASGAPCCTGEWTYEGETTALKPKLSEAGKQQRLGPSGSAD